MKQGQVERREFGYKRHGVLALYAALPILLLLFVLSLLSSVAIGGLSVSFEAIQPKFDRLSPAKGLGRMFGTQAAVELIKAAGKFIVLGLVTALILRHTAHHSQNRGAHIL